MAFGCGVFLFLTRLPIFWGQGDRINKKELKRVKRALLEEEFSTLMSDVWIALGPLERKALPPFTWVRFLPKSLLHSANVCVRMLISETPLVNLDF